MSSVGPHFQIALKNVGLVYDLYYDKTNNLKERLINAILKRKYVSEKVGKLHALKGIDLEIHEGERLGIIGLNGAGKSTLLKVISGILKPSEGTISVSGRLQPLIEIAAGFDPEATGRENIYLNGYMLGFSKEQITSKEKEIIDFTDLGHFIDVPVKYYSSGMSVRLAFTIATTIDPEILVFDEMLAAGDVDFMRKARARMDDLIMEAKILILVSHDVGMIQKLTNRVIVLKDGCIVFDGKTREGIDYYFDRVALGDSTNAGDEKKKPKLVLEKSGLKFNSLAVLSEENSVSVIPPRAGVSFEMEFSNSDEFSEVFVNFLVLDKTENVSIHLRNDFQGVDFDDVMPGQYSVRVSLDQFPLKSGKYQVYSRLVGVARDGGQVIIDSPRLALEVSGEEKYDQFLEQSWKIESVAK